LLSVSRSVPSFAPAESVLAALLDGPTERESQHDITTEIPTQTRLLQVAVRRRVAEVNLSREFQQAGSRQSVLLRVAQVVQTVTTVKGVDAVVFLIDGVQVDVPTDRGVVERPVTVADYASVGL
jgi:spore germination protein GerM